MTRSPNGPVRRPGARCSRAAAVLLLAGALVVLVPGCRRGAPASPPEVPRNVRVLALATTDFVEELTFSGTLRPVRGTDVAAEEGGVVTAVVHDQGDTVRVGDVLVRLDDRSLRAALDAARADLALAAFDADRTARLFAAGKVSEQEKLAADSRRDRADAAVRMAALRVEKCAPAAPFAGVVAARYVEPGQLVAPGRPVARVVDPYVLKLVGALTGRDIAWIRPGEPATVTLEDGTALDGTVVFVGPEADVATGKFPVEVRVANPDLALRPGLVGRAVLTRAVHRGALAVPRDAVITTPAGTEVYVVEGERAHRREVILGPGRGLMVMVRDGLRAGELLVVRGQRELVENALVRITERAVTPDGNTFVRVTATGGAATGDTIPEARP